MTLDQIEGNEPIHENWGTNLGDEIDEVGRRRSTSQQIHSDNRLGWRSSSCVGREPRATRLRLHSFARGSCCEILWSLCCARNLSVEHNSQR